MIEESKVEFENYIKEKNIEDIRISIESSNALDPNGERREVEERLSLLRNKISDDELYEKHDNDLYPILPKEQWDEDYFNKQKVKLQRNFSKERLDHVRELGKFIFPVEIKTNETKKEERIETSQKKSSKNNTLAIIGILAVGVVAAIVLLK